MKKDFFVKAFMLPVILGIIFAVAEVVFFNQNADAFSPVYEGTSLAYFDSVTDIAKVADKPFDEIRYDINLFGRT